MRKDLERFLIKTGPEYEGKYPIIPGQEETPDAVFDYSVLMGAVFAKSHSLKKEIVDFEVIHLAPELSEAKMTENPMVEVGFNEKSAKPLPRQKVEIRRTLNEFTTTMEMLFTEELLRIYKPAVGTLWKDYQKLKKRKVGSGMLRFGIACLVIRYLFILSICVFQASWQWVPAQFRKGS